MRIPLRALITFVMLISVAAAQQAAPPRAVSAKLAGRWHVKFSFSGTAEKNLIFDSKAKGAGFFLLLDTGPDDKAVPDPVPAVWSELSNNRVSFSGEAELPMGTCCREVGTLIFKGRFQSSTSIAGRLIFVTSVDEEESPYKFRSEVGTFIATQVK